MMKNYDQSVEINRRPNWPYIPDHPCRIIIIGGSGSGKNNVLLNLIKYQQPDIDKTYLYVKDKYESNYLIMEEKQQELKKVKAFIDYLQTINNVYENFEDYNPRKKRRV